VAGARVDLAAFNAADELVVEAVAFTDPVGKYEGFLSGFLVGPFTGRLRVAVTPPEGANLRPGVRDSVPIEMGAEPLDTAIVDMVLSLEAGA
jgi:hypothetical protein